MVKHLQKFQHLLLGRGVIEVKNLDLLHRIIFQQSVYFSCPITYVSGWKISSGVFLLLCKILPCLLLISNGSLLVWETIQSSTRLVNIGGLITKSDKNMTQYEYRFYFSFRHIFAMSLFSIPFLL